MLPSRAGSYATLRSPIAAFRSVTPIHTGGFTYGVRHKSEPSRLVDEFPYKHLSPRDASHMSAEMESTARLPLRSFFAQHRPLMPFARPPPSNEMKWVHFPMNARPLMEDRQFFAVPEQVARQLGPFDRASVMRKTNTLDPVVEKPENAFHPPVKQLNKAFGIGKQILQQLQNENVIYVDLEDLGVEATSVQRKRKLKMNRHKYRKRLKEQRTKRRRLGK